MNTAEYACMEESCRFASSILEDERLNLSELVAVRCIAMAQHLEVSAADTIRLEFAAKVHRIGELAVNESLRRKSFIDMTLSEIRVYRYYPVFSALRFSTYITRNLYEILLHHREYSKDPRLPDGDKNISLAARILCVATEYEELLMYSGEDANSMMKNHNGQYNTAVLNALMLSIVTESVSH